MGEPVIVEGKWGRMGAGRVLGRDLRAHGGIHEVGRYERWQTS
jgi:hypothetical protein